MAVYMEERPLKVTIIGAGIAGLTAALALRKQGHEVTVRGQDLSWRNHR